MYYQPDTRWPLFGASTREHFEAHYVFPPRFHAGVPTDVVQSYTTASHLMALAWYHYPVYDEALAKLLLLLELAVKLRCQQLGLPTNRNLQQQMMAVDAAEPAKQLGWWLQLLRQLRNQVAHPERHSFGGDVFRSAMPRMVNTLNRLFEEEAAVIQAAEHCVALAAFGEQPVGLTGLNGHAGTVHSRAQPLQARWVQQEWRVVWAFFPVVPRVDEAVRTHGCCPPLLAVVVGELAAERFRGVAVPSREPVELEPLPLGVFAFVQRDYQRQWESTAVEDRELFLFTQQQEMKRQREELAYQWLWK